MGVGIGGGGFGLGAGVKANSKGVGVEVGVGPFKMSSGCAPPSGCLGYLVFSIALVVALTALVYIGPVLLAIWAGWMIYRAKKDGTPLPTSRLLGLAAVAAVATVFSVWIWGYTIDEMKYSKDLPSVHSVTVAQAQSELRAAGFRNTEVDYGTESPQSTSCIMSGTTPEAYERADARDVVVIHVSYCP